MGSVARGDPDGSAKCPYSFGPAVREPQRGSCTTAVMTSVALLTVCLALAVMVLTLRIRPPKPRTPSPADRPIR